MKQVELAQSFASQHCTARQLGVPFPYCSLLKRLGCCPALNRLSTALGQISRRRKGMGTLFGGCERLGHLMALRENGGDCGLSWPPRGAIFSCANRMKRRILGSRRPCAGPARAFLTVRASPAALFFCVRSSGGG